MGLMSLISLMGLSLMGCSSDSREPETQEPTTGTAIVFSANQDEQAVTRATSLHSEGVSTFRVWAYKNISYDDEHDIYTNAGLQTVMPNYTVNWQNNSAASTTTNSSGWEYVNQQTGTAPEQTIKYWDWGAKAYRFFGVTGNLTGAEGTYGGSYKTYDFTIEANANKVATTPYFSQLWFSTGNITVYPTREFGKPVELVFMKPYAKVRFMYTFVFPREGVMMADQCFKPTTDYTAEEADKVKINTGGTFTVRYPLTGDKTTEWFTTSDITTRIEAFYEDYDPEDDTKVYTETDEGWYTVLPNITQGSYTLTVSVNNLEKSCTVPAEYMKWQPGYSYTYIFKINEQGGVEIDLVQSAFTPWTELTETHDVYNW